MRRLLAVVLVLGAAAGVTVAIAQERRAGDDDGDGRAAQTAEALPAPDAALHRTPQRLAQGLTATTRRLRAAVAGWDPAGAAPRDVTYLALHHQRMLRWMAARRALGDATLALLPRDVLGEARDAVRARRHLAAIPRSLGRLPRVRVADAAPAAQLRRHYGAAQRRFGVHWSVLAAVNFVESAFGRVRSASEAGLRDALSGLLTGPPVVAVRFHANARSLVLEAGWLRGWRRMEDWFLDHAAVVTAIVVLAVVGLAVANAVFGDDRPDDRPCVLDPNTREPAC